MRRLKRKINLLSLTLLFAVSLLAIAVNFALLFGQTSSEAERFREAQIGIDKLLVSNYLADCENKFILSKDDLLGYYRDYAEEENLVEKSKKLSQLNSQIYQLQNFNDSVVHIAVYEKAHRAFLGNDAFLQFGIDPAEAVPAAPQDSAVFLWNNLEYADGTMLVLPLFCDFDDVFLIYFFDISPSFITEKIDHDLAISGKNTFFAVKGDLADFSGDRATQTDFEGMKLLAAGESLLGGFASPLAVSLTVFALAAVLVFGTLLCLRNTKKTLKPMQELAERFRSSCEYVPLPETAKSEPLRKTLQRRLCFSVLTVIGLLFLIFTVIVSLFVFASATFSAEKLNGYHASQLENQLASFEYIADEMLLSDELQFYYYKRYGFEYTADDAVYTAAESDFAQIKEFISRISRLNDFTDNFVLLDNAMQPFDFLSGEEFRLPQTTDRYYYDGGELYYCVQVLSKYKTRHAGASASEAQLLRPLGYIVFSVSYKDMFYLNTVQPPATVRLALGGQNLITISSDGGDLGAIRFASEITQTPDFRLEYELPYKNLFNAAGALLLCDIIQLGIGFFAVWLVAKCAVGKATKQIEDFASFLRTHPPAEYGGDAGEIELLVRSYNGMIERIDALTRRARQKDRELTQLDLRKKEMELIAFQTQLNPHFLANAMANASAMIMTDDKKNALRFLSALSDLLKKALYRNASIVPLREEVDTAKAYIKIQKLRFKNRIKIFMHYDENILRLKTLKLVLQPVLENMYMHGIEPKGKGIISVDIFTENEKLLITVQDDGVGMTEKQLADLRRKLETNDSAKSLGLVNVNQRIKLNFGSEYGVHIDSKENEFCKVTIILPVLDQ